MTEKYNSKEEKFSEYREYDFENGVKLIYRILDNEPSLRFIDKDGKDLVDLMEFAPAGTVIETGKKWDAGELVDGGIFIRAGEFGDPANAILSFLHEAGHLNDLENGRLAHSAINKYSEEKKKDEDNAYPQIRLKAMAEAKKAELVSERNAWAFALKKARDIERRLNIKIFDKIAGEGNMAEKSKKMADKFLGSYERKYLDELYDMEIYTEEEMENFFQELEAEAA